MFNRGESYIGRELYISGEATLEEISHQIGLYIRGELHIRGELYVRIEFYIRGELYF